MTTYETEQPRVVSPAEWLEQRNKLLEKEKELTRLSDRISAERRDLPRIKLEKNYVFDGPAGKETLADLFGGRSQLIVYHFMFGPDWEEGCPSCSFVVDHVGGAFVHLSHRDVAFAVVSRATVSQIEAFKKRMGWSFKWVSSNANDFNRDFHVSFSKEEMTKGAVFYNYKVQKYPEEFPADEAPGFSVFSRDSDNNIFYAYSCFGRGVEFAIGTYHLLDLVPKGRDEARIQTSRLY